MARFRRTNLDGKSITETRLTAAALLPGTFAYINEDGAFAQADAPMGRLYVINPGYHQGLGIEDAIPQGSSAVGDYVEEGREFAVRIASGTYLKDQPITVNASGNAEAGASNIVGYSQESVTLSQTDFLRIRMRTVLEAPAVASVTVAPATLTIEESEASQLTATILPVTANQGITWTSSDDAVAEVDATGLVTGIAAGGPVTITATSTSDPSKTGTCAVTVTSA